MRNEWRVRRKRSRGGIREIFGRTLGNRASIYKSKVNRAYGRVEWQYLPVA